MVTQLGTKELQALYDAHRIRFMLMSQHGDTYDAIIFNHIGGEEEAKKLAKKYK